MGADPGGSGGGGGSRRHLGLIDELNKEDQFLIKRVINGGRGERGTCPRLGPAFPGTPSSPPPRPPGDRAARGPGGGRDRPQPPPRGERPSAEKPDLQLL